MPSRFRFQSICHIGFRRVHVKVMRAVARRHVLEQGVLAPFEIVSSKCVYREHERGDGAESLRGALDLGPKLHRNIHPEDSEGGRPSPAGSSA
jgi:hypothetical protein